VSSVAAPQKETKAQRVERLKREQNPWEGLAELRRFSREGFSAVPPAWLGSYFRWWGLYTQGDGAGVTGGKGGEGKSVPYLMLRIRIPSGLLFSHQLRTVADLCRRNARGVADITVRHNIQLHWVEVEALPELLETLWRCGLNTMGACGDVTRNITGCPLAGVDADEVFDASPWVYRAGQMLVGNPEFYNLPRKYKISISGCRSWCAYPEINDIGLTAVTRTLGGKEEPGFSLRVGGGLSTEPYLAARLDAFVQPHQVLPVIQGISRIFRDSEGLREHRERARLKYLFLQHGWTAERFLAELHDRIGFHLDPAVEEELPNDVYRDHVGIRPQKQAGYCSVGAAVSRGRITPEQMEGAAELADRFGNGELRTTVMQNLVIPNVPERRAAELAAALGAMGLPVEGSSFSRGAIACTGAEFCKLAITETKGFTHWLSRELDERLPGFDQPLKIHVTGCPNSCGQHWIADVGIEGKKLKVDGKMVDAYYFFLGGALGQHAAFARKTGYRCAADEVPDALERLLRGYLERRTGGENLRGFFARSSEDQLRALLAGAEQSPAPRDAAARADGTPPEE
jgi:sulfite reductase (ferredoxin)